MDELPEVVQPRLPTATVGRVPAQTEEQDRAAKGGPVSCPGAAIIRRTVSRGGPRLLPRLILVLVCGGYAAGAALGWGSPWLALVMGDFGLGAAALVAAFSCLRYARRRSSRLRPAWLLFAVSSAMAGFGNAIWGWYEVVLHRPVPSLSLADFFFLLFAPPAIVGLLVFAKRPATRAGWTCLVLDAWLIGGSLLTISWSLALAQTAERNDESVARAALSLAYPLFDIVLVSMVLALHFRRSSTNRSAINTAIAALALTVLCDALFTSPLLREHYRSGQLLDAGWFAGSILLAYAPWVGRRDTDGWDADRDAAAAARYRPARDGGRPIAGSLGALTPYLAAAVCSLGILHNIVGGRVPDRVVVFTACTVVLALVVRQGIMLLDNITLTHELAQKENHFRSLVQGSSDVIMIAEPSGELRYVSPAAAGVYGIEPEELVGTELASLIHPEDLGTVVHELRRFLAAPPEKEPTTRIECRFRAGGGRPAGGEWLNVESTVNRHHGGLILNSRDVTERVRLQEQLQHSAEHDPLTDLPNRALFAERVRQALSGRRTTDPGTAVLFIDLDGFKAVNDRLGHHAGDELLIHAARRLQESVRAGDTAARLGGDEFAALILGDGSGEAAARECRILEVADRLRSRLSRPYRVSGTDVRVAASIGVAFAEPGITPTKLMRNADLAMYRAKAAGKGRVELYGPQLRAEAVRRTALTNRLGPAFHDGEFALLHQPVVDLGTGRIAAVTAHARWRSQQGILFTPDEFLRVCGQGGGHRGRDDESGQSPATVQTVQSTPTVQDAQSILGARTGDLCRWLLEQAVAQAAERHRAGHPAPVAVRISPRRLMDRGTGRRSIETLLTQYDLPPDALVLELADGDPRIPLEDLERRLTALRRLGVRVALDGFGRGGAALGALRRLPVDVLKFDRSLVEGVVESARLYKITAGLLRIAADLGVQSVADGVDLPEQVVALRGMGCTHGQGMAFSGPLDEHRLRRVLALGEYPVPDRADARQVARRDTRKTLLTSSALPVRLVGAPAADAVTHPPLRSNSETPVPPT